MSWTFLENFYVYTYTQRLKRILFFVLRIVLDFKDVLNRGPMVWSVKLGEKERVNDTKVVSLVLNRV